MQRDADDCNHQRQQKLNYTFRGAHICAKIPEAERGEGFFYVFANKVAFFIMN